jgi:CheY-like chemotaxis protein
MNLAVNARDSMAEGGNLSIETSNVRLDGEHAARVVGARDGDYIMIAVSDDGAGMSAEVQKHIFEPFYTTKELGKGTGLGLATVYGIVKQSGGYIWVYSELGQGTTIKIYLPRADEEAITPRPTGNTSQVPEGTETIMLVEDEEMVRNLSRQILESCGYKVIVACDGAEAFELCKQPEITFDLLVTDVVMPKMSGRQLADELETLRPGTTVLFMSGYTDDAVIRKGVIEADSNFIQKPFTFINFAQKVREMLDRKVSPAE